MRLEERAASQPNPRLLAEATELCGLLSNLQRSGPATPESDFSEETPESLEQKAGLVERHLTVGVLHLPAHMPPALKEAADDVAAKLLGPEAESATLKRLEALCAEARTVRAGLQALEQQEADLARYHFILETMKKLLSTLQRPNAAEGACKT
ncbi:MAG: hypothetical protein QM775_24475 [Pirellulales bacterium]